MLHRNFLFLSVCNPIEFLPLQLWIRVNGNRKTTRKLRHRRSQAEQPEQRQQQLQ